MSEAPQLKPVLTFLRHHPIMTVATIGKEGEACLATVYVYVDKEYKCYFVTRRNTRKFHNLQKRAEVVLATYDARHLRCVEMRGIATPIKDKANASHVMTGLLGITTQKSSACWMPPVGQLDGEEYVFIEVSLQTIRYYDYSLCSGFDPKPVVVSFHDGALTVSENYPY